MTSDIPPFSPLPQRRRGFILISTLLVLALLVALVVGLLTISRMEYADSRRALDQYVARTNAKFAAKLALSELQLHAGPDQATTATADLLDNPVAAVPVNIIHKEWTGVWNYADLSPGTATDLGLANNIRSFANGKTPAWLVSRPDLSIPASPVAALSSPVEIAEVQKSNVTPSSPTSNAFSPVRVDPYDLADNGGKIAWWVSDEGVKAVLKGSEKPATSPGLQERIRLSTTPQRPEPEKARPSLTGGLQPDDEAFDRLYTTASINLLDGNYAQDERIPADVTVSSRGVLSNQRRGGLKTDLTAAFESNTEYARFLADSHASPDGDYIYGPSQGVPKFIYQQDKVNLANQRGYTTPLWEELFSHYRLYRPYNDNVLRRRGFPETFDRLNITPQNFFRNHQSPEDDTMAPAFMPRSFATQNNNGQLDAFAQANICPLMVSWQLNLGVSSYRTTEELPGDPTANPEVPAVTKNFYTYRFHVVPALVLWNPYNVQITSSYKDVLSNYLAVNLENDGIILGLRDPSTGKVHVAYRGAMMQGDTSGENKSGAITVRTEGTVVLAPGEVRVFGIDSEGKDNPILPALEYTSGKIPITNQFLPDIGVWHDLENITPLNGALGGYNKYKRRIANVPSGDNFPTLPAGLKYNGNPNVEVYIGFQGDRVRANDIQQRFELPVGENPANIKTVFREKVNDYALAPSDYASTVVNPVYPSSSKMVYAGTNADLDISQGGELQQFARCSVGGKPLIPGNYCPTAPFSQWSYNKRVGADSYQSYFVSNELKAEADGNLDVVPGTDDGGSPVLNGFWGKSGRIGSGRRFIAAYDIPRQPLHSVGSLMHAEAIHYELYPAYPVGNSYVPPFLDDRTDIHGLYRSQSRQNNDNNALEITLEDRSFLSNSILFDSFFFSTVPSDWRETPLSLSTRTTSYGVDGALAFPSKAYNPQSVYFPYARPFDDQYVQNGNPLPNPRIQYYGTPNVAALRRYDEAAANLMVDGSFNVNSTSVVAWQSMLSGLISGNVPIWENSRATGSSAHQDVPVTNGVARMSVPVAPTPSGASSSLTDPWTGLIDLTDREVTDLAAAIVDEVRERGPFFSLGDFVNRRLDDGDHGYSGALQTAIDNTSINDDAELEGRPLSNPISGITLDMRGDSVVADMSAQNIVSNSAAGIPGFLLQNDLLRHLAPVLNARSDTFIIRSYGEAPAKAGSLSTKPRATAKCEMVVQRVPEFVDQANPAITKKSALNSINNKLGRRFKIVSFRWQR